MRFATYVVVPLLTLNPHRTALPRQPHTEPGGGKTEKQHLV